MSTTTIRLPEDLKSRVAEAAQSEGVSTHAFMVEAIARRTLEREQRDAFIATGVERWQQFVRDGKSVSLTEMRRHVKALASGHGATAPKARKRALSRT